MKRFRFSLALALWMMTLASLLFTCFVTDSRVKEIAKQTNQLAEAQQQLQLLDPRSMAVRRIPNVYDQLYFRVYSPSPIRIKILSRDGLTILDEQEVLAFGEYVLGLKVGNGLRMSIYKNGEHRQTIDMDVPKNFRPSEIIDSLFKTEYENRKGEIDLCRFKGAGDFVVMLCR